jgi:hypothetical protein
VRLDGFHAQTRTFFRCVLDDVIVPGKSNLLLCSGRALLDFQGAELDELPLDLDVDPAVVEARSRALTVLVPEAPQVIDEALSLVGVHTYAFGHWLHEFLPKVWACLGLPEFASLPIVVDAQMPTQHREALELFAGPHHPIVVLGPGQGLRVKRLWTCSMIMYLPPGPLPGSDAGSDSWAGGESSSMCRTLGRAATKAPSALLDAQGFAAPAFGEPGGSRALGPVARIRDRGPGRAVFSGASAVDPRRGSDSRSARVRLDGRLLRAPRNQVRRVQP